MISGAAVGRAVAGVGESGQCGGTTAICRHCNTPFVPSNERLEFCCAGCEYVHRLITGQNLDKFYSLRRGATAPVRSVVFQPRDFRWLEGLVQRAELATTRDVSLVLDLQGVSCVGCVWLIEKIWRDWPGTRKICVNATLGRLTLHWVRGDCDVVEFARELQKFGYLVGPASRRARTESQSLLLRMGMCAAFALNGMLFSLPAYLGMEPDFLFAQMFTALSFLFAAASVATGGTYFFVRSWRSLKRGVLHIDLPISLGILAGFAGSIYAWSRATGSFTYFDFVSTFTFLMLVGRWTQLVAVERNRHHLLGLQETLPEVTLLQQDGIQKPEDSDRVVTTRAVRALEAGDRFVVGAGAIIPVSSSLLGPAGSLGLDWISGESDARAAFPGQVIESGAMNLSSHPLRVEALESWESSLLARLVAAPSSSDSRNRALERVIRVYLFAVLALGGLGGAAWLVATGDVTKALQVAVSVLVVSCPCALGVTLPLIDELVIARLRKAGVFVQSASLWSRLKRVRKIIFDKTGTLTLESLVLRNPEALESLATNERAMLWTLVRTARHPVAACLRETMLARGLAADGRWAGTGVREEVGFGLEFVTADGCAWRLGRDTWVNRGDVDPGSRPTKSDAADVAFGCDGRTVTRFITSEEVRADAVAEIGRLRERGFKIDILSGDRNAKVAAMAWRLGLPENAAAGEMTPTDKEAWVRRFDERDTLMIGDGANDSLAFGAAYCRGTPAVERGLLEHRSDFFFLGRGLAGIGRLFDAAAKRHAAIARVLAFAIAYNLVAVVFALAGGMSPLLAAVLMPASALVSLALAVVSVRRL